MSLRKNKGLALVRLGASTWDAGECTEDGPTLGTARYGTPRKLRFVLTASCRAGPEELTFVRRAAARSAPSLRTPRDTWLDSLG